MKWHMSATIITVLCLCLFCSIPADQAQAQGKRAAPPAMPRITVLNPMGTPPPVQLKQMAPRLTTLEGKNIYFVNTGYIGTDRLMAVMSDWFKANYPKTNIVIKESGAGVSAVSKTLWTEIAEKGDAAIIGLGH